MKAYGYKKGGEKVLDLREVTILCSLREIDSLIQFLEKTKQEFNTVDKSTYDGICHNHYRDYNKEWTKKSSDLIIYTDFSKE